MKSHHPPPTTAVIGLHELRSQIVLGRGGRDICCLDCVCLTITTNKNVENACGVLTLFCISVTQINVHFELNSKHFFESLLLLFKQNNVNAV